MNYFYIQVISHVLILHPYISSNILVDLCNISPHIRWYNSSNNTYHHLDRIGENIYLTYELLRILYLNTTRI